MTHGVVVAEGLLGREEGTVGVHHIKGLDQPGQGGGLLGLRVVCAINIMGDAVHVSPYQAIIQSIEEKLRDGLREIILPLVPGGTICTRRKIQICTCERTNIEDYGTAFSIHQDIFRNKV